MTSDAYDTIDALLARYVAGALPEPARVLVDAHLELKPLSRGLVRSLEAAAGDALDGATPIQLPRRAERLDAIFSSATPVPAYAVHTDRTGILPVALRNFIGHDADDIPWRTKMPGFREFDMGEIDGCHVSLFWIRPGRKIPHHTHDGSELTLVVDGAFADVTGRYGRGDIAIADDHTNHRPIAEKDRPCISFAVTDAPLRFNGPIGQRLSDIMGF